MKSNNRILNIVVDEVNDNGNILEKTVSFKIPTSDEFAKDFSELLKTNGDKKYKIRFEDA